MVHVKRCKGDKMKREDLKKLGIEEKEVIDSIMQLYGDGIQSVKSELETLKAQVVEKDASITELTEKAKALDGTESTLKELQDKVETYEKGESDRIEAEKQAKINQELLERFSTIKGEQKFNHDLVEKGRFEEFKKALADEQFKGKGDLDIFQAIVKPEDLANPQQQPIVMPGGNIGTHKSLESMSYDEYKAFRQGK